MKIPLYTFLGTVLLILLMLWLMTQINYRIGNRHLKITIFGITLRKIGLDNIVYATKREPDRLSENWYNTFKTNHRLLTIERERGLFKYVCITPRNRYVFLADLRDAVRRVNPKCEWAKYNGPEEGATTLSKQEFGAKDKTAQSS
jgi:hypothetical protein